MESTSAAPTLPSLDRREPRVPFFSPVVAHGLNRCWATNLSASGIGLCAFVGAGTAPARGDDLQLEVELGEGKSLLATGRIAWTSHVRPDGRVVLGAQFHALEPEARTTLAMFLAEHRPRVLVTGGSQAELDLATRSLGDLDPEIVDPERFDAAMLQSCASIVVFCHEVQRLIAILGKIAKLTTSAALPGDMPSAPVVVCTSIDSNVLLPISAEGRIYQVLRPPLDAKTLRLALERSCEKWALQVELRWASLQLEGLTLAKLHVPSPAARDPEKQNARVIRESPAMVRAYELIGTVAGHDVPVLLLGETGTGKELAAREIHALSKRSDMPFVAQDCGALTETLLESELFGHVRGAFTGATTDHPGLFQIADGGTIFLDEIQNTSPTLQAKLLRVVEQGEVRPVGGAKTRRVNIRLIAACNVDLRQAVKDQRFRPDFFYRLNRFPITLPPLREHVDDILPLTRFFLDTLCPQMSRTLPPLDPRVDRALLAYDWPGNIRELRNAIERAILLTPDGETMRVEALPPEVRGEQSESISPVAAGLESQVQDFERRVIQMALEANDHVVRRAARALEINPVTLARKMKKLGL